MTKAAAKRCVDIVLASLGLVATTPLLLFAALAVRSTSPGPVLHRAIRAGRGGRPITVHKFRSMRIGPAGTAVTAAGDPRITRVGRTLRTTKIDELPQLWDVLVGSMSIVGPRPEDLRYVEQYSPNERRILRWRPGITSPASLAYRHEEQLLAAADDLDVAYAEVSAAKIAIDVAYFDQATLSSDVGVMLRTFGAVFTRSSEEPNADRRTGTIRQ
jgi:lipopolysaccharide/colanic/teichoic acid biosynthesis glycosyltransferase